MNTPRIALMDDPLPDDVDAAIVTSVHNARALLSDAEDTQRAIGTSCVACDRAVRLLDAALASLSSTKRTTSSAFIRVHRAMNAAKVALAHGELAEVYRSRSPYDTPFHDDALEERNTKQTLTRFYKAATFARAETHRALAQLAEDFPHAYATIDAPDTAR